MGKKRKHDQRRDESSSSDANRHRSCHCQNGDSSRSSDGMPREGLPDAFRDAVIELKDFIQVKVSTEEKFKRKFKKLKQKRKKDKNKQKEFKEYIRILKEDVRSLKESHEELKSKFQETQKEGCAEVNHYDASPSQRSQLNQSIKFRLVIENEVRKTIYKRERVETVDGGGRIKVVMYDGVNQIASDHPLASVRVDLVVIEGWFNECKPTQDSWSKEEFEKSIIQPRKGITRVVKNGIFNLVGGSCAHEGAIIMDNSQQREVKLGVMIAMHTEERVLEGVSNPFKVQEARTKNSGSKKKGQKHSSPVPTGNLVQPTNIHETQHGHSLVSRREQHSLPPPAIQGLLQTEDHGKHKQFPTEDNRPSYPPATIPLITAPVEGNGQGYSLPPRTQHALQAAGNSTTYQLPHYYGQCSSTSYDNWNSTPEGENVEDLHHLNAQKQNQEAFGSFTCGQVLLRWDKPDVELKQRFDFLDQLMPPFSTHRESFPSTSLIYKAHKLLASVTRTPPHRRGVLIRPIEPYYSDDEPTVKKQRHAKYQLRFVNRVCNDYYTREQIKSDDGNLLKVALYDENNLVVTSGPLSSTSVEVVLLHGDFNAEGEDNWTSEEFSTFLVCPQSVKEPPALGGDRVLVLIDGEADLGNINFQNSSFHARTGKFKMGVEIKDVREERVQEGITGSFLVRARQREGGFSMKSNAGGGEYGEIYKMESVCENTTADFKKSNFGNFLPNVRSGGWSDIGSRQDMEDTHVCIADLAKFFGYPTVDKEVVSFYGVFDGHGGKHAAHFVRDNLPRVIVEDADFPLELEKVVSRSFVHIDGQFADKCSHDKALSSGTTALTAMIFGRSLLVANAGDCRAVLSRCGIAMEMSMDHRPCSLSETLRVESLGGYVNDGYLNGLLGVTRALGDWQIEGMKEASRPGGPLSAEPEIKMTTLTKDDEFLIIGSDGIWDVFSNQNAVDFARRRLQEHNNVKLCCKEIVEEAIRRGANDNLTAVLVSFHLVAPPQIRVNRPRVGRSISADGLNSLRIFLGSQ